MRTNGPFTAETAAEREWLITNGLGGYASATLAGMLTRRYHGLLVGALQPPGQRTLLVAKLEETVNVDGVEYALSVNEYPGAHYPLGNQYLREFICDDGLVTMRYAAGGAKLDKTISMVFGENTTLVKYTNSGDSPVKISLTPLVNARDFHGETADNSIGFRMESRKYGKGMAVNVIPHWMADGYWLISSAGVWIEAPTWYRNMTYAWERRRGLHDLDNHFSPGSFSAKIEPGKSLTVTLSTLPPEQAGNAAPPKQYSVPADSPEPIRQLYSAAHTFIVRRGKQDADGRTIIAGYHWFGDWGRDTMIALPGLCLTTGRYEDAANILRTFAAARRRGLLPNLFLDSGEGEAYNAVDASLWFVNAVYEYYAATKDKELVSELQPALEEIIHYYRAGTDYGIHMAEDGLIDASSPGWQLTWMDAKVGDWVVTPRMGKPVDINALWYNALRVMDGFAHEFGWDGDYCELAGRVRDSFWRFWNSSERCLYDVLADSPDPSMRPNQIFAVSLPYSPLDNDRATAVVDAVERYLLTPYGLRTLAAFERDYRASYRGNVWERDGAYHQGTVWPWLIGPFVMAYLRVRGNSASAKQMCRSFLQPLLDHVNDSGCIGTISEIFDGSPPYRPNGTVSQAWSVSEVLRAWEACR